jgi:hypothetical protein
VAQGEGPEFKPQYYKRKGKEKTSRFLKIQQSNLKIGKSPEWDFSKEDMQTAMIWKQ